MSNDTSTRKKIFLEKYPEYGYKSHFEIDQLRNTEFNRLKDQIFLDHAGATLHADSQLRKTFEDISQNIYGNPHSANSLGNRTSHTINKIRDTILQFFNTTSKDYSVIFTSGCTAALKLVGENFPWSSSSKFLYLLENHNSVLGIREYALSKGASFKALSMEELMMLDKTSPTSADAFHLIAFPAENNFSGERTDLNIVKTKNENCKVLVDAACYASHAKLDLSEFPADFVTLSFYKIFGYPTGLGALIVRNDTASILQKKYFGGGTVAASMSQEHFSIPRKGISEKFEDGTISFLTIISLQYGFEMIEKLGGIQNVDKHTHSLEHYLYNELINLRHYNGNSVCVVYGNHESKKSGPILSFNLKRANGEYVGYHEVDQLAGLENIYLRTGCFCNPGSCHKYLNISKEEVVSNLEAGHVCWDDKDIIRGKPTGAVRASIGYMTTFEDVEAFLNFVKKYFVQSEQKTQVCVQNKESELVLDKIYVYPVKSCGRFEAKEWEITSNGLLYDREWVLVDDNGTYLNQKKFPRMCLIRPTIDLTVNKMYITAPGMNQLTIDLSFVPTEQVTLQVCGDTCSGFKYDENVNGWFSEFLETRCYLMRNSLEQEEKSRISGNRHVRSEERRAVSPSVLNQENQCKISYSNESQFLIVSEASIEDVNSRLDSSEKKIKAPTFRPNLVIKGGHAFQEDEWEFITIGNQLFKMIGPCNRCKMICVDQDTSLEGKEPLLTLASYRRSKGKILFGSHSNHISKSPLPHKISCGATVSL